MNTTRFLIRRDRAWAWLLVPFGGTNARSYVAIDAEKRTLDVRFGFLFHERIAIDDIQLAEPTSWPLLGGIGWRTNLVSRIGLIGSYEEVVRLRLKKPQRMTMPIPIRCSTLCISVLNRDAFLDELHRLQQA